MARFKLVHKGLKFLPVDFDRQVLPGSFEFALCHLVDQELDLSGFHKRYEKHGARSRIENIADELSATGTRSCNSQYLFAF